MTIITTNIDPKDPNASSKISNLGIRILQHSGVKGWFVHRSFDGKSIEFILLAETFPRDFNMVNFINRVNASEPADDLKIARVTANPASSIPDLYSPFEPLPFSKFMSLAVQKAANLDEHDTRRLNRFLRKKEALVKRFFEFNNAIESAHTSGPRPRNFEYSFNSSVWKAQIHALEERLQADLFVCINVKSISTLKLPDELYSFVPAVYISTPLDNKQLEGKPRAFRISFNVQQELKVMVQRYATLYPQRFGANFDGLESSFTSHFNFGAGAVSFGSTHSREHRSVNVADRIMMKLISLILEEFQARASIKSFKALESTYRRDALGGITGFTIGLNEIEDQELDLAQARMALADALDILGLTTVCQPQQFVVVNMKITNKFLVDGIEKDSQNPHQFTVNPRLLGYVTRNPGILQQLLSGEIVKIEFEVEKIGSNFTYTNKLAVTSSQNSQYNPLQNVYHRLALAIDKAEPAARLAYKSEAAELTFRMVEGEGFYSSVSYNKDQVCSIAATSIQSLWRGHAAQKRVAEMKAEMQQTTSPTC